MIICQNNVDLLQPPNDLQDNVDWTRASQLYSNLSEIPSFISSHRQSGVHRLVNCNANPRHLQGKKLYVYNIMSQHLHSDSSRPIRMIVSGTAGTGKSYLINCLKILLKDELRVCAPTGVASYNIQGYTLHNLFSLPTKGDLKSLKDKDYMIFNIH